MKRWSVWKKLVVFPLIPVALVLGLCAWIVIADSVSEPRMIEGRPDDAPRMAALFLGFMVIAAYTAYLVILGIIKVAVGVPKTPLSMEQRRS